MHAGSRVEDRPRRLEVLDPVREPVVEPVVDEQAPVEVLDDPTARLLAGPERSPDHRPRLVQEDRSERAPGKPPPGRGGAGGRWSGGTSRRPSGPPRRPLRPPAA